MLIVVRLRNTWVVFSVRHAYKILQPCSDLQFTSKGVGVPSVPTKSAFFAREAAWGKALTLGKLQRQG